MLLGHIAPNVLPQLLTYALLGMGIIMILEGALSFVGLGVPPPAPSWGNMIAQGQSTLSAGSAIRVPAECGLVHHGGLVQPLGRGTASPLGQSMNESLLDVSDLRVDFRHDGRLVRAVDGLTYSMRRGRRWR